YQVRLLERGTVAANVRAWGHVKMFSPFGMNRSPLGLAALAAQNPHWRPPDDDALLTGRQYAQQYLVPLAQTDLLADCIEEQVEVVAIGRTGLLKGEQVGDAQRADVPFRVLVRRPSAGEQIVTADVVVDATGTYGNHGWVGEGGIPAVGEADAAGRIAYDLPEILGRHREDYAGRHTLLVGAGYSAATSALALAELAVFVPGTRVTWVTRRGGRGANQGPLPRIADDPLVERDRIACQANALATSGRDDFCHIAGVAVEGLQLCAGDGGLNVLLAGDAPAKSLHVDRVLAHVGYCPDTRLFSQLQVHLCYATDGPIKLAARLGSGSADCLDQISCGPESLVTSEPNFYVLGSKSYGRNSKFLISRGLQQIRDLFTILGGRQDLDLYGGMHHLTPKGEALV
nr:hypothetical protein [Planctomycetales bacterium]NIM07712.1 hypothetical protein [Planctomycetales bacterium]NIN07216.1 hypothetical protein [Planctomycetales bacterium]NIN76309.1 hypothetical protein [Planctomycetales bacterium]NIO33514.1 hypothetical protein [Planctomycetales bacterium]